MTQVGVIFDLDGTLVDSQMLHARVESEILAQHGVNISPEEITKQYAGVRTQDFFNELLKNRTVDIESLIQQKWMLMNQALEKQGIETISVVMELLTYIKAFPSYFSCAIGSASPRSFVEFVLHMTRLRKHFDVIIGGDMVTYSKPHPETFLLCSELLEIKPEKCIVIEDGKSGIIAAKTAGMKCIGYTGHVSLQECIELGCDSFVSSDLSRDRILSAQGLLISQVGA